MKTILVLLLFSTLGFAQSRFDGTWVAKMDSVRLPSKPEIYQLQNGKYECETCIPKISVPADGNDHHVAGSPYFSSIAVRVVNHQNIQITEKQRGELVYSETDSLSPDQNYLTEKISDSSAPRGEPVTAEEAFQRVGQTPPGANPISGSWQAEKIVDVSSNALTVTYLRIKDGLKASNPGGEGYSAKFDGKDYPIQGAPDHSTVSLKRINANTIVETDKLAGRPHYVLRLTISHDGNSMRVTETDLERGTKTIFTMDKASSAQARVQ